MRRPGTCAASQGRVTHRFDWTILVATLAVIPVMVIELETSSSGWRELAFAANCVIWAIFVAELAFILWVAPRKAAALKAHWLDEVIIVMTAPLFGRLANEQSAPFAASFRALAREPALQSPRPRPSASAFDSSIPAPDSVAYVSAVAQ